MFRTTVCVPLFLLLVLTASNSVFSEQADSISPLTIASPTGKVILKVGGSIQATNGDGMASFDYNMLKQLGLTQMSIETAWTDPGTVFEGVKTRALMEHIGATGKEVYAVAADGYEIRIPFQDFTDFNTLFALSMNGKKMRLRDKGPVWILYDNDNRPEIPEPELNSRMIWQLEELRVR